MNFKVACTVALLFFSTLQLSHALKCYRCNSESSCKNAQKYECSQVYGNETMRFLDSIYSNVNTNVVSKDYKCIKQELKVITGKVFYKGCIYNNVYGCGYTLRPYYQQGSVAIICYECNNHGGCNPASRNSFSFALIALSMVIGCVFKFFT